MFVKSQKKDSLQRFEVLLIRHKKQNNNHLTRTSRNQRIVDRRLMILDLWKSLRSTVLIGIVVLELAEFLKS